MLTPENSPHAGASYAGAGYAGAIYFGCYAPHAAAVSLLGSFNRWLPGRLPLQRADREANGWWHAVVLLPAGRHTYRFWIEPAAAGNDPATGPATGFWRGDDENPLRSESGYHDEHSVIVISS